ncbi:MAG: Membrane protein, PerM family protein [uncultured bacterium]|nr:MAG: Membrane protein, PerM family protein [uncultured bacterium]
MKKVLSTWFQRYLSQPEAIILLIVFIVAIVAFKTIGGVLAPIIVGIILAYLLFGMVKKLQQWRFPHLLAVSVVFTLFVSLVLLLFLYLLPLLWEEMASLISDIPTAFNRGQIWLFSLHDQFPDLISVNQIHQVMMYVATYLANFGKEFVTFSLTSLFGVVTVIVYLVLVPLLVFFFLRDGKIIIKWLMQFLPEKREVLEKVWHELYKKISSYIRGKIIEVVLVALITVIAFWILGLRYAVLLGALVGLSVVIPYIGVAVVTVPIVIVGLIQWGWSEHFFYLMLVYTIISIFDANVLVPILFAEVMNLHPLAIILAVLLFGSLFGFWGVFFAIPLMALVNVVIEAWPKEN